MTEITIAAPPSDPLAYKAVDAARVLAMGESKLYELIKSGDIEARKRGSSTLVTREECLRHLASLPVVRERAA